MYIHCRKEFFLTSARVKPNNNIIHVDELAVLRIISVNAIQKHVDSPVPALS